MAEVEKKDFEVLKVTSENDSGNLLKSIQEEKIDHASKSDSHDELDKIKRELEKKALIRQEKIKAWDDYISFIVSKVVGVIILVGGSVELIKPTLLPIDLKYPEILLGIGLTLLIGQKATDTIASVTNSLRSKNQ